MATSSRGIAWAGALATAAALVAPGAAAAREATCPAPGATLGVAEAVGLSRACDLTGDTVRNALGFGVGVAARGAGGSSLHALATLAGGGGGLTVVRNADGTVSVTDDPTPAPAGAAATPNVVVGEDPGAVAPCKDGARNLERERLRTGYSWYYNTYATPSNVAADAESYVYTATRDLAGSVNSCGLAHPVVQSQTYRGRTSRFANISTDGNYTCQVPSGRDGYNVTSWLSNAVHPNILAVTCNYFDVNNTVVESDAVINRTDKWFTSRPGACTSAHDLWGVVEHERGHTWGLDHSDLGTTDPFRHDNLTMNSEASACTYRYRTLGLGDVRGLDGLA